MDDVRTLSAKHEITEALHRYARAVDRLDRDLMESLWHEGATVAYDNLFKGTAIDSIDWIWRAHEDKTRRSVHCVTNVLIEVNGDTAASAEDPNRCNGRRRDPGRRHRQGRRRRPRLASL